MRDAELNALLDAHQGQFPREIGPGEINDVEPWMLEMTILGAASHYENNSRPLSGDHRAALVDALQDWDRMWPGLPTDASREYFSRTRGIALYLLERRSGD